jgi:hypothetical protein
MGDATLERGRILKEMVFAFCFISIQLVYSIGWCRALVNPYPGSAAERESGYGEPVLCSASGPVLKYLIALDVSAHWG